MSQAHSLAASLAWQVHLSFVFSILLVKQYISIQYILPANLFSIVSIYLSISGSHSLASLAWQVHLSFVFSILRVNTILVTQDQLANNVFLARTEH